MSSTKSEGVSSGRATRPSRVCKVNWRKTTLPKHLGGLGVLDLDKFARVLRLR
jgi:hypothetical protein